MIQRIVQIASTAAMLLSLLTMTAFAESDLGLHRDCAHCGMDRKAYGYSRMLVEYKDGKKVGTCSLHCVVTELNSAKDREVLSIKVADRNTQKLIEADKAVWTIGGRKRGIMSARAKWAFAAKTDAQKFVTTYGGATATWSEAMQAAKDDAAPKAR